MQSSVLTILTAGSTFGPRDGKPAWIAANSRFILIVEQYVFKTEIDVRDMRKIARPCAKVTWRRRCSIFVYFHVGELEIYRDDHSSVELMSTQDDVDDRKCLITR